MKSFFYPVLVVVYSLPVVVFGATTPTNTGGTWTPTNAPSPQTTSNSGGSGYLQNPLKTNSIVELFSAILDIILILATPIIIIFIILAGFKYVTARGNTSQISEANKALLNAVIGGVLILGAKLIMEIIKGTIEAF